MTYYPTLAEDIARAKEILAKGKAEIDTVLANLPPDLQAEMVRTGGGTIFGADIYAAYKLLESFVEAIEVIGVDVVKTALRLKHR